MYAPRPHTGRDTPTTLGSYTLRLTLIIAKLLKREDDGTVHTRVLAFARLSTRTETPKHCSLGVSKLECMPVGGSPAETRLPPLLHAH